MLFPKQSKHAILVVGCTLLFGSPLDAQEVGLTAASEEKLAVEGGTKVDVPVAPVVDPAGQGESGTIQQTADEGIQIQVEKSTGSSGSSAGPVKVYSPWPAKPLADAPGGWKYVPAPAEIPPYKQSITLSGGKTLDLSITPFVLEPVSDGVNAIRIAEPGYDPARQYAQQHTVAAMLQKSTMDLEENERHAAKAISLLQQLLSSLPQKKQ